ncbi:hypothetical protein RRG08_004772 [Elysia crispata]|uniref:Uncharacterized protein n=1 Tax=Elysia crispata TaxID=231223 RepID=A0AAE1DZI0_9GAST|nr:hypothetical protein RRG08_004772 [Elysia crispata]
MSKCSPELTSELCVPVSQCQVPRGTAELNQFKDPGVEVMGQSCLNLDEVGQIVSLEMANPSRLSCHTRSGQVQIAKDD